jgi:DNA-binding MarR family transcriptional regulator
VDAESVTRLRVAVARVARLLNPTSTEEGLTPSQASVLGVVAARGPIGLAELTALEGLNPTMLSRIVSKLDELDYIDRLQDPEDLRAAQVVATPAGAAVHERIRTQRTHVVSQSLEHLPKATLDSLARAVPALEALVEQLRVDTIVPPSAKGIRGGPRTRPSNK